MRSVNSGFKVQFCQIVYNAKNDLFCVLGKFETLNSHVMIH